MKPFVSLLLVAALIGGGTTVAAGAPTREGPDQKRAKHDRGRSSDRRDGATIAVQFSVHDARVIRDYYAPQYRSLPPGLQKKLARGGQLPPGWQKKLQPFPVVVERELVVLPDGYRRGVIDGYAVVYNPRTQVIVDIAVLF